MERDLSNLKETTKTDHARLRNDLSNATDSAKRLEQELSNLKKEKEEKIEALSQSEKQMQELRSKVEGLEGKIKSSEADHADKVENMIADGKEKEKRAAEELAQEREKVEKLNLELDKAEKLRRDNTELQKKVRETINRSFLMTLFDISKNSTPSITRHLQNVNFLRRFSNC